MIWIVIIIGVIIAAFVIPRFGRVVVGLVGLVVALGVIGAIILFVMDRRQKAERELAKTRIRSQEVELVDLVLRPGYSGSSFTLVGRVRNRSGRYTLNEMRLKFTMKDCGEADNCEVVGQTEDAMYVNVPPGQARDLNESVYFTGLGSPRGKHQWDYQVVEIIGR